MDNIQNAALDDQMTVSPLKMHMHSPHHHLKLEKHKTNPFNLNQNTIFNEDFKYPHEKYSREANWKEENIIASAFTRNISKEHQKQQTDDEWHAKSHERVRRAPRPKEENKNTCSLYIQTDPLIWRHIREGIADVSKRNVCTLNFLILS